jgi:signal transduction histidine kinase
MLLLAVAAFVAAAILWSGVTLAKRERFERIERDRSGLVSFDRSLQEKLDDLEAQYEEQLESLSRTDLNDRFALRDAIDAVIGVRQFSTLSLSGKIDMHLLASDFKAVEADVPLPVFSMDDLPLGRKNAIAFEDRKDFGKGLTHAKGWMETGDGNLFFFCNVSDMRTVLLLIDRPSVSESVQAWLADWMSAELSGYSQGESADAVSVSGAITVSAGEIPDREPDMVMQAGFRFGNWQIHSWDARQRLVEYDRGVLAGTALLAVLVLMAAAVAFFYLNRALKVAEQRVSFVNRVSHELKSPLTNILLNTDLAADETNASGRKRLAMVSEEARRLSRLIDNVLTFSRKEHDRIEVQSEAVTLRPLIDEVIAQFQSSIERRGIEVEVAVPATLAATADADALTQILGNLISNVEKYAAKGGMARIEAEARNDEVRVRVCDRGPGIPRSERERIFLPFRRLDDRTKEGTSGTGLGLGLAIASDLAKRMGGSLRLISQGNEPGATFELRLPLAEIEPKVIDFPDSRAS